MIEPLKTAVCRIARKLGLSPVSDDWTGIDAVLPMIELMRQEGAVVIMKFDGERTGTTDNRPYTFVVSGGRLAGDHLRLDTDSVESGLAHIIAGYFESARQA